MPFERKTWYDRQVEFPNRRRLDPTEEEGVYDVSREEGAEDVPGTPLNAANFNDLEGRIKAGLDEKADVSIEVAITLSSSSWAGSGPFAQTVNVSGVTASTNAIAGLAAGASTEQGEAYLDAQIHKAAQGNGTISFTAYGDAPTVNIPISVVILG